MVAGGYLKRNIILSMTSCCQVRSRNCTLVKHIPHSTLVACQNTTCEYTSYTCICHSGTFFPLPVNFIAFRAVQKKGSLISSSIHIPKWNFRYSWHCYLIRIQVLANCCVQGVRVDAFFESNFLLKYSSPRKSYKQSENVFLSETVQLYFFINGWYYSLLIHVRSRKTHFSAQLQFLY